MNDREYPIITALREFARSIAAAMSADGTQIRPEQTLPWVASNHIINLHSSSLWESGERDKEIDELRAQIESLKARLAEYESGDR